MIRPNDDKVHHTYSTRDIFKEYRKYYKGSNTIVNRVTWNLVIDSIISKLKEAILVDKQIYKPRGGIGHLRMAKIKNTNEKPRLYLQDEFSFYLKWEKKHPYAKSFKNKHIYKLKSIRNFKHEIKDHVDKLANDPYQRDYNTYLT